MKIFVTVGTTAFPELLNAINKQNIDKIYEMVVQSTQGDLSTFNNAFSFIDDIESWYNWADVIITHAGAGSVYNLLEKQKKLIVVPNTYRQDKHQLELANFVKRNKLALVCYDLTSLMAMLEEVLLMKFNQYSKDDFTGVNLIVDCLFSKN